MIRLIDHLKALGYTNHSAREAMATGKVSYRDVPTADAGRMVDPSNVRVDVNAPRVVVGRDPLILWADEHCAVVLKPPGLLSVSAPGRRDEGTVVGFVARRFGHGYAVHRLDEGTSGLILVALDPRTQQALKDQLEDHGIERRYLALVAGRPAQAEWTVRSTLIRDRGDGLRGSREVAEARAEAAGERFFLKPGDTPKPAVTHFQRVRAVGRGIHLVGAKLESGRTHQVRIHLAEGGTPVVGDPLYADKSVAGRFGRLALHAAVLAFQHPHTRRQYRFEAPLADDLEAYCRVLAGEDAPRLATDRSSSSKR